MQYRVLIVLVLAIGCRQGTESILSDRPVGESEWLQDLDTLATHLSDSYGNIQEAINYRGLDPVALIDTARSSIRSATTDKERVLAFYRFLGSFRDGHLRITNRHPSFDTLYNYPIRLGWEDGRAVVTHIDDEVLELAPGDAVVAINDQSITEWIESRGTLFGEGNDISRALRVLRNSTGGPLAPEDHLKIEATRGGRIIVETFYPTVEPVGRPASDGMIISTIGRDTPASEACDYLGARTSRSHFFQFRLSERSGFNQIDGHFFDAGILRRGDKVGIVRFPSFRPMDYRAACETAWVEYQTSLPIECDESCQSRFKYRFQPQYLLDDFHELLMRFNREEVATIAIDLTGNGGGSDFSDAVARMLARPITRCQQRRIVKHPRVEEKVRQTIAKIELAISMTSDRRVKRTLRKGLRKAQRHFREVSQPCDLRGIWRGESPSCMRMTDDRATSCGFVSHVEPGLLPPDLPSSATAAIFNSSRYEYQEALFDGKVIIIADRHTSSAAEFFLTLLKDGAGATVIGEKTNATGCGYIDGGFPISLDHAGLNIKVPNCARMRINGENELFGIAPDVSVDWLHHNWNESTDRLLNVLW